MNLRRRLRELIAKPGLTLMPGVYDALSARIVEAAGFECALAGGYAAIGSMLAQADSGQSNVRDYAEHYARICDAVNIPVYVDADTGFGGVHNIRQMVRMFERAGAAGLFISDQTFPNRCNYLPGKQVVPVAEMVTRIKAALDARRDGDLVICARTDVLSVEGLDAAIDRCRLFLEAGADYAKAQGVHTAAEVARVVREVRLPLSRHIFAGRRHPPHRPRRTGGRRRRRGVVPVAHFVRRRQGGARRRHVAQARKHARRHRAAADAAAGVLRAGRAGGAERARSGV